MAEDRLMTDREQWFARHEQAQEEAQVLEVVHRGHLAGVQAAAFAASMWEGLAGEPFTHEQKLRLLAAALRGR